MIAVLVCGGRDYRDRLRVFEELDALRPSLVVHGARPVWRQCPDWFADEWAAERGVMVERMPPLRDPRLHPKDWPAHNARMVAWLLALMPGYRVLVLAFRGGRGTADIVRLARQAGVQVRST
jgi:hypothetical protein